MCLSLLLNACGSYDITVNERLVYNAESLFTDYTVEDARLQTCIDQTIKDQGITSAAQLARLSCSDAGISQLKGIGTFSRLSALNLRNNHLTSIAELGTLSELRELIVAENQLKEASAILTLLKLEQVDLRANPKLHCRELKQFVSYSSAHIQAPNHCSL